MHRGRRRRRVPLWPMLLAAAIVLLLAAAALYILPRLGAVDTSRRYPVAFADEIRAGAAEFSIEPAYVAAVILAESSYDPEAVSHADARGLMQLLPSTAEWIAGKLGEPFDENRLFEPEVNIRYGCWYLHFLLDRYGGDKRSATAAYHAGQGRVDAWLRDSQYSSDGEALEVIASNATNTYVNRVLANYDHYATVY